MTQSQARDAKLDLEESVQVRDTGVPLAETCFKDFNSDDSDGVTPVMSCAALIEEQKAHSELNSLRETALSDLEVQDVPRMLCLKDNVLLRKWHNPRSPATDEWSVVCRVLLPPSYRPEVLCLAYVALMPWHVGIRKTQAQIMVHFYGPQLHKDVVNFCQMCHVCQVVGKSQLTAKPAPLIPIPGVEEPSSCVLVDFDRNVKVRIFKPGDSVLMLMPISQEPLASKFHEPYNIERKFNEVNNFMW